MEQTRWIKPDGTNSTSSKASQVDDVLLYPVSIQTLSPPYQGCYNLHVTLLSPYNPDEQSPYNTDKQQLIPVPNCTTEGECARSRPILHTHTYRTRTVPCRTRTVPCRAVPVPYRTVPYPYRAVPVPYRTVPYMSYLLHREITIQGARNTVRLCAICCFGTPHFVANILPYY